MARTAARRSALERTASLARRAWRKKWLRVVTALAASALLAYACEYAAAPVPKVLCELGQKALHGGTGAGGSER